MRRYTCAVSALLLSSVVAHAQGTSSPVGQALLCIPDLSTGLSAKDGKWHSTDFNIEAKRFLVKPIAEQDYFGDKVNYEIRVFGESFPQQKCFMNSGAEMLICNESGEGFKVNFRTMRFMDYYLIGYIDGNDTNANTPYISIGTCSPL